MVSLARELRTMKVSQRDQEIYERVVVQRQPQRQVGLHFQISQQRVGKIVSRVARWLSQTAPYGLDEIPRPQRLYLVARTYKMKLEYYEARALRAFDKSEEESFVYTEEIKEGKRTGNGKLQKKNPRPDAKLLLAAKGFAAAQAEFEGFAPNGAVARNNDDRLHEVAELPHDAEIDAFINVAKRLERERDAKQTAAALAHPKEPLLRNSPEVSSTAENTQPNHFDNTLLLADEVGNNKEERLAESPPGSGPFSGEETSPFSPSPRPSPRSTEEREWGQWSVPAHRRLREEDRANGYPLVGPIASPVLPDDPPPEPGRVFPPTPPGYIRGGFRCYPAPIMKITRPDDPPVRKPFKFTPPPRYYELDKKTNEWVANW
jgi:hypothetical protein